MNIRKMIWIEFLIWFVILCFIAGGIRVYRHKQFNKLSSYQIFLPDVDGLIVGSPVKFMGVQIGYIQKIKILSNEVYVKFVITEKGMEIPDGSIVNVEFNGMGGSKSLEVYPPTEESLASKKLLVVNSPKRLHDSLGLLNDMFDKIGSITTKLSFFANETGVTSLDMNKKVNTNEIQDNMNLLDKWIKNFNNKNKKGVNDVQSDNNQ